MRLIDADALKQHIDKLPALPDGNFAGNHSALKALINMQPTIEPSAQPDLLDDGTLMMTVPNGMLNDVKRVMVDEVGTKNCKVMYQDEPERKKSEWIKISPANIYECSECGKNVMTDDISAYDFCHGCGVEMEGESNG